MNSVKPGMRKRIAQGDRMLGSFIKLTDPSSIEIFGGTGFDFVVIDQEHGPFDRQALNIAMLAARAAGVAGVVRVPQPTPDLILSTLDVGATGILAPHIVTAEDARGLVSACRYRSGRRGFSGVTRAGGYGSSSMWQQIDASDAAIAAIAMIEDPPALDHLDEILAVDGLDAIFIGRGDLTVAFGARTRNDDIVVQAVDRILEAARRHGKPVLMLADNPAEAGALFDRGIASLIVSSDQGLLRKAAAEIAGEFRAL
ncbi:HpcH/HpaI aldolase family protein [Paracoccus marinaquae]|uniref:Aldolase n=1 Tax=Paracoccus marinaquae TaxID=2841926 RepID=A0ABS6AKG9_9RHOB|nr:aldolase/citrate lyase family protein [Paracoccus marinaquae]MBU3031078.1 aldolase [Paracoccus marinaquae]